MAPGAPEVGFIFQCVLCGSYTIFAVDALDPAEVERRAAGIAGKKSVLQTHIHAAEEEMLERVQQRLESAKRYVLLPCATCLEILLEKSYAAWLDDKENLDRAVQLTPQLAVTFEADELPAAYVHKAGKWSLAQGLGPKSLEVKLPHRLPAGQFRVLLPVEAQAIRPSCWESKGGEAAEPEVSQEEWKGRRSVIEALVNFSDGFVCGFFDEGGGASSTHGCSQDKAKTQGAKKGAASLGPSMGAVMPWLDALIEAAMQAYRADPARAREKKGKKAGKMAAGHDEGSGARYVRIPLLAAPSKELLVLTSREALQAACSVAAAVEAAD
eukprot:TRINITY_DN73537_c0_g1_i1.p1 TRINITY_DN73537_c0_g1~~TRINITY_DN73537_c0_g1_i1.p1  ORF type:complete len:326 (-),score=77.03 TRINITY_DN73537_c0_g1_i1:456-1433(-)